jgi:hypothetical protein
MARRKRHGLMGEVNLLGLDSFGQNPGMSPITGALIGGGVAGGTLIAVGQYGSASMAGDREFYGLLAGLAASGALWLSGESRARHASWGAAVGAFFAAGLPWLEKKFGGTVAVPAPVAAAAVAAATGTPAAPGTSGVGMARIHALNGLGIAKAQALNGQLGMRRQAGGHFLNGLGLATMTPQSQSAGTIPGVHGPAFAGTQMGTASPVNLLGGATAQSRQVSLLGGPPIHGLSAAYGATLLGGGRS